VPKKIPQTTELIKDFFANEVLVDNGRFATPHATYLAALGKGAKTLSYEAFPLTNNLRSQTVGWRTESRCRGSP
jgi:hypothetical protein